MHIYKGIAKHLLDIQIYAEQIYEAVQGYTATE